MSPTHLRRVVAWALLPVLPCAWWGCNLAPQYSRPTLETPAQFREAAPPTVTTPGVAWNPAQPGDAMSRGHWWELYGDEQLNALEPQVEASNQTLAAAEANFRAARAATTAARSAFFPRLTTAPSFTRSRASATLKASPAGAAAPAIADDYSLPIDASYEVDFWGRIRNTVAASTAGAQAAAADLATARLSLQAELAQDYFQLRASDTQRQLLDQTVASYRESLNQTSALFRAGIDSEEDVARAQTQLDTTVAQATDLRVPRAALEHAIAVLIGKAPANFTLATAALTAHLPPLPIGLPSNLLERRPDIAAAERRAAAANAEIGVARAAYFPSLTLDASAGWQSGQLSRWFEWPSRFWLLGPQLAETLFDGGARRAQTQQSRAEFDQAAANYRETILTAFQNVEDNLAALRILEQEAGEQRSAVESAQHLLDLTNIRFRTGIDSFLNVILAQTALLSNREAELQIQLRQITASISLMKALGGGWNVSQLPAIAGNFQR